MRYLLDTNVVCEPTRAAPNARVLAWIAAANPLDLYVSVITLAEIEEASRVLRPPGVARLSRLGVTGWPLHLAIASWG